MEMKRPTFVLLLAIFALAGCETTHRAAVSTFRVIDAPHAYVRRQLGMDNGGEQATTTTSTSTTQGNVAPNGAAYSQPYQQQQAPPRQQYPPQRQVVSAPPPPPRETTATERTRETEQEATPTPAPQVTSRTSTVTTPETDAKPPAPSGSNVIEKTSLPYAKPVPGKAGYVFSPYDKNGGYVDVTGFAPGSKVKDPYSGKVFLVP